MDLRIVTLFIALIKLMAGVCKSGTCYKPASSIYFFVGSCPTTPPNFPSTIPLVLSNYRNWIGDRQVNNLWMAIPAVPNDIVTLANWAKNNSFRLRASGCQHSYSPLTVTSGTSECSNYILVNTTNKLTAMEMLPDQSQVRVQTGAQMNDLLAFLESKGYGLYNFPTVGDITIGGALAIDAHGTSILGGSLPEGAVKFFCNYKLVYIDLLQVCRMVHLAIRS